MADGFLKAAELSDIGRQRKRNEDASICLTEQGVFAVFDGMGGAAGGEEASRTARECLERKFRETADLPTGLGALKAKVLLVRAALNEASKIIRERADSRGASGSGTTAVCLVFDEAQPQRAIILHAGDSRVYRCRKGELAQLTRDHSFAVAAGVASERSLPPMFRGVVTRAVGLEAEVILEETLVDAASGDFFLLCTDGLTKMISDNAIVGMLANAKLDNLMRTAHVLVEESNAAGGQDNTTVVVVGVSSPSAVPAPAPTPKPPLLRRETLPPPAAGVTSAPSTPKSEPVRPVEPHREVETRPAAAEPARTAAPVTPPTVILEDKPSSDMGLIGAAVIAALLVGGLGYWMFSERKDAATHPDDGGTSTLASVTNRPAAVPPPEPRPTSASNAVAVIPPVAPQPATAITVTAVTVAPPPVSTTSQGVALVSAPTVTVAVAKPVAPVNPPPVVAPSNTVAVVAPPPVPAPPPAPAVAPAPAKTAAVEVAVAVAPTQAVAVVVAPPVAPVAPPPPPTNVVAVVPVATQAVAVVLPRPVPPALVLPPPTGSTATVAVVDNRSPADVAAAQAMMEMLMTDIVTALGAGHWQAVEDTLNEWAPSAPREAAQVRSWSVYRGWAVIWREAATGQRPAGELFETHRAAIQATLAEIGSTNTTRFVPVWGSNPKRNADLLCQGRFRGQNILVEAFRAKADEAARLARTINEAHIAETAARLRAQSAGRGPDGRKALADFSIRAELLGAAAREARGNPVPLEPSDFTRLRDGWTGMRVAEELVWQALLESLREPVPTVDGEVRTQMDALRAKALDGRRAAASWSDWMNGDGPAAVLKYLIFAGRAPASGTTDGK